VAGKKQGYVPEHNYI